MKKTKFMTRLSAVVFALALLFAMAIPAFAADDTYEGTQTTAGFGTAATNNIPITKGLVIFNPDGAQVREPNISFVYTATPAPSTALGTITDSNGKTVTVKAGPANSVTSAQVDFAPNHASVTAPATGIEVEKTENMTVVFDNSGTPTFTHAGVYRYLITETIKVGATDVAASALPTYGLEARTGDYSNQRYLDVYIVNGTTGLELSAAIIFKTDAVDESDPAKPATQAITRTTDKTTGFEPGVDPDPSTGDYDYTDDASVDRYFTYNLKVGKTTTGNLADKDHNFPFVITLKNANTFVPNVTADIVPSTGAEDVSGTTANTVVISNAADGATVSAKMSDGDYVTINGLPKGTTADVKETNDTKDEYTAAFTKTGTTTTSPTTTRYNASNEVQTTGGLAMAENDYVVTTGVAVDGGQTASYVKTELGYTNTISDISPTGLVFRVAPYVLMLLAGVSLVLLFTRRRREVTDMI